MRWIEREKTRDNDDLRFESVCLTLIRNDGKRRLRFLRLDLKRQFDAAEKLVIDMNTESDEGEKNRMIV